MYILKSLTIGIVASFLSMPFATPVKADAVQDAVNKIVDSMISKASGSADFVNKFCRQASFGSGIFSVRSFEGRACQDKRIAALAEIICGPGDVDRYASKPSQCHTNALAALKGADPMEALKSDLAGKVGKVRELVCSKTSSMPSQVQGIASKACGSSGSAAPAAPEVNTQ